MDSRGLQRADSPEKPHHSADNTGGIGAFAAKMSEPGSKIPQRTGENGAGGDAAMTKLGFPSGQELLPLNLLRKSDEPAVLQAKAAGKLFNSDSPAKGGVGMENALRNEEIAREFEKGDPTKGEQTKESLLKMASGTSIVGFTGDAEARREQAEVVARMTNPTFKQNADAILNIHQ